MVRDRMRHACTALVLLTLCLVAVPLDYSLGNAGNVWGASSQAQRYGFSADPESAVHLKLLLDSSSRISIHEQTNRLSLLGRIGTVIGDVVTLDVPSASVPDLGGLGFVRTIETSRRMRPLLDVSVPEIGALDVWQNLKDEYGREVRGSGSLVGIVDTGIDCTHPDFFFENGTSKIAFIWDQSGSGNPPIGFSYGIECTRADIESKACQETDEEGHGTHVAGIAASAGLTSGKYYGVAPDATILFVKARPYYDFKHRWSTDDAAMIDGVNYLWQKAQALGQPIVINLSLGWNIGPHDDTSLLERAMNEFAAKGAIIVVSAGNDADGRIHAAGTLAAASSVTVNWSVDQREREVAVDIWYSLTEDFAISVKTPSGQTVQGPTPSGGVNTPDGRIKIASDSAEKGKDWFISATSDATLRRKTWSYTLTGLQAGECRWDAWISRGEFLNGQGYEVTAASTVGDPATASGVITVGAYATKLQWTDSKGEVHRFTQAGQTLYDIAYFSSLGPTRDGRTKPDIVAPGLVVASARSLRVPSDPSDPDEFHTVLAGTSMAAPHVTGLVALILQLNPYLTVDQVKQVLRSGARTDSFTHAIDAENGSNTWGWGKADAKTSVPESATVPTPDFTVAWSVALLSVSQGSSASTTCTVTSLDGFGAAVDLSGSWVGTAPTGVAFSFATPITPPADATATSTLLVNAEADASVGNFTFWTTASSGAISHMADLQVQITAGAADFTVTANPPSMSLGPSRSGTSTIEVQSTGIFSAPLTLTTSGAPSGLNLVFSTNPVTPPAGGMASSVLTVTVSGAPLGNYTITITGISGAVTRSATLTVQVTAGGGGCLIATATFGSELSDEVQFLRGFRDDSILKTSSGSGFMTAFNAWYYSFSPTVAEFTREHSTAQTAVKFMLYPLIGILRVGATAFNAFPTNPEVRAVVSGLVVSSLVGAVYFAPPITVMLCGSPRARRISARLQLPALVVLLCALATVALTVVFGGPAVLMMFATSTVVVACLLTSALFASRAIAHIVKPA